MLEQSFHPKYFLKYFPKYLRYTAHGRNGSVLKKTGLFHIVRILTTGKPLTLIDQGIVDAIQNGNRVLVKAGSLSANFFDTRTPGKLESENRAIASWAESLSQEHGLVWERVGPDVLFTKPNIPS